MSLADLIARGGAVAQAPSLADAAMEGIQAGQGFQANRLRMQGMEQANQASRLANLAAQQQQGDLAAVREAQNRATSYTPEGGVSLNRGNYLSSLVQGGRGGIALTEQARLLHDDATAKEAQIAQVRSQHKALSDVLYGVKGPLDFAAALPVLEKMGVDISDLRSAPFRTDWRDILEAQINQGLDLDQKLKIAEAQAKKQKDDAAASLAILGFNLDQQKFGLSQAQAAETTRHNRAMEGIDWYKAKNPASVLTDVKAPAGYRYNAAGDLEAIPGGPADVKVKATGAKAQAEAQRTIDTADQGIATIDQLLNSGGLGAITGIRSKLPIIPGTDQAKADAIAKQIEGQAFLQAFAGLKGGGQITEVEGAKATTAIARLQRGQSKEDYSQALRELRGILQTARTRAATGQTVASEAEAPTGPQIGTEKTVNGVTGVWDGKTWRRK